MAKPVITIDIDGVIFDTPRWLVSEFNAKHGTDHHITELFDHGAHHNKDILVREHKGKLTDHYHATQKRRELYVLNDGCEAALRALSQNYTLIALTSRNFDEFAEITDELVELHIGQYIDRVVYTTEGGSSKKKEKGAVATELGSVLHIDDSVEYCLSCQQYDIPAILFTQPYNEAYDYDPVWRAKGWDDIPKIIAKLS